MWAPSRELLVLFYAIGMAGRGITLQLTAAPQADTQPTKLYVVLHCLQVWQRKKLISYPKATSVYSDKEIEGGKDEKQNEICICICRSWDHNIQLFSSCFRVI